MVYRLQPVRKTNEEADIAMKNPDIPMTAAVRVLRAAGVSFTPHFYPFSEQDVALHAADYAILAGYSK
jgi:hypothetical protein